LRKGEEEDIKRKRKRKMENSEIKKE